MKFDNKLNRPIFKSAKFADIEKWETNRRSILKAAVITGVVAQFSYLSSCQSNQEFKLPSNIHFNLVESGTLYRVLNILFPNDGNGPGIDEINAFYHILWVMDDSTEDPDQMDYLKNGVKWIEEIAQEEYNSNCKNLSEIELENLVKVISKQKWGKDWLSMLLTLIFEAVIIDDIYHKNSKNVGWEWLEHIPGQPRPNSNNSYDQILNLVS